MLTAEELTVKLIRGHSKYEWQKIRERNESLDCRIYARAAAAVCGMDRYKDKHWKRLEADMGVTNDREQKEPTTLQRNQKKVTIKRRKSTFL